MDPSRAVRNAAIQIFQNKEIILAIRLAQIGRSPIMTQRIDNKAVATDEAFRMHMNFGCGCVALGLRDSAVTFSVSDIGNSKALGILNTIR